MRITALVVGMFAAAILAHLCIWRVRIPKRQLLSLLLIMLAALPIGLALAATPSALGRYLGPLSGWACLHAALIYVAMSLAYVVVYSPLQHRSPSMTILTYVADAKQQGRTRQEIVTTLKEAESVAVRLDDMVAARMAADADGLYRLTAKGWFWAWLFYGWLKILGREKGG
jgi:hypothetical protein